MHTTDKRSKRANRSVAYISQHRKYCLPLPAMSLSEGSFWTVLCPSPVLMQENHTDEGNDGSDDGDRAYPPHRVTCSLRNLGLRRVGFQRQERSQRGRFEHIFNLDASGHSVFKLVSNQIKRSNKACPSSHCIVRVRSLPSSVVSRRVGAIQNEPIVVSIHVASSGRCTRVSSCYCKGLSVITHHVRAVKPLNDYPLSAIVAHSVSRVHGANVLRAM